MKAVAREQYGVLEQLKLVSISDPLPHKDQVLVRILAWGSKLNC